MLRAAGRAASAVPARLSALSPQAAVATAGGAVAAAAIVVASVAGGAHPDHSSATLETTVPVAGHVETPGALGKSAVTAGANHQNVGSGSPSSRPQRSTFANRAPGQTTSGSGAGGVSQPIGTQGRGASTNLEAPPATHTQSPGSGIKHVIDKTSGLLGQTGQAVSDLLNQTGQAVSDLLNQTGQAVSDLLNQTGQAASGLLGQTGRTASGVLGQTGQAASTVANAIGSAATEVDTTVSGVSKMLAGNKAVCSTSCSAGATAPGAESACLAAGRCADSGMTTPLIWFSFP